MLFRSEPHSWNYRIDYRTFKNVQDFADYVQLFEDSGWHHIGGTKSTGYQYFVQVRPDVESDIFSDSASKAARYHKQGMALLATAFIFSVILATSISSGSINLTSFFHPQDFYLTPGLWEKPGTEFWRAFLFETPFALGRGYLWLLYVFTIVAFLAVALRSYLIGRKLRYSSADKEDWL